MRFYLDSMVWIYALEGDPAFGVAAQRLLHDIRIGRHTLLTSYFLLGEITVLPARRQDAFTIASYRRLLLASPAVEVVPLKAKPPAISQHCERISAQSPPIPFTWP